MKTIFSLLLFLTFAFPSFSLAEGVNAGFVQGIWFSSEQIFADQPTRVYVALRNNTNHELTGTVYFTDNGTRIGASNINALSGRLVEAWVDWKPKYGTHVLSASLQNTELHPIGENTQEADVADTLAESTVFVDYDTDSDGVGNDIDEDDDNDGTSDLEEVIQKSDPLTPNPKPTAEPLVSSTSPHVATSTPEPTSEPETPKPTNEGLEKYVADGVVDSFFRTMTDKVNDAKYSLDNYRAERNRADEEIVAAIPQDTATMTPLGTYTEDATITRSTIVKKDTFMGSFIDGIMSLLHSIWTLILWILSKILAHPEFVQIFILVSILYIFYRTARRIGSRPNL